MNVAPLRRTLESLAEAEADSAALAATRQATAEVAAAEEEAAKRIARARAEGEAAARREVGRTLARARSDARALVLGAQRDLYEELCNRVAAAALELRHDPGYGHFLQRLQGLARARLGEQATLDVDPPDLGGVRASSGSRQVDLSLAALAERGIAALGPELERLWR